MSANGCLLVAADRVGGIMGLKQWHGSIQLHLKAIGSFTV